MTLSVTVITDDDLLAVAVDKADTVTRSIVERAAQDDPRIAQILRAAPQGADAVRSAIQRTSFVRGAEVAEKGSTMTSQAVLKSVPNEHSPHIGMTAEDRAKMADVLKDVLSGTYVLMGKTQAYHWNVAGPLFYSFHKLTEEHYENLFAAADDLAERVRALGHLAPFTYAEMMQRAQLPEHEGDESTEAMIKNLVADHQKMARVLRDGATLADEVKDHRTHDMLTERLGFHEEAIWMLEAIVS